LLQGGDVQWVSQFPGEKEILFAPLTGLEVAGDPVVEGSTIVVELRLNCNLHDMTIEEVRDIFSTVDMFLRCWL
jgi:hypothetical protein